MDFKNQNEIETENGQEFLLLGLIIYLKKRGRIKFDDQSVFQKIEVSRRKKVKYL
jgi:hypothetical protein